MLTQTTQRLEAQDDRLTLANPAEPAADPAFQRDRISLPAETDFPVPGDGFVQRMTSSLFAKDPLLAGQDQNEARSLLQIISMWLEIAD